MRIYNEVLSEGKSVGKLYHFTDLDGLSSILSSNRMRGLDNDGDSKRSVSVSRGHQLEGLTTLEMYGYDVRITLNGDKISQGHKIVPFLGQPEQAKWNDPDHEFSYAYRIEREERIYGDIERIDRYILKIDVLKSIGDTIEDEERWDRIDNEIAPSTDKVINIVNDFTKK